MPNLKAALAFHTQQAQRAAAVKKAAAHKDNKAASIKASVSGLKKAAKKKARAVHKAEGAKASTEHALQVKGDDGHADEQRTGELGDDVPSVAGPSRLSTMSTTKVRPTIPFTKIDTILLLGEANFSFARSLLTSHAHPPHQILATSYDSEETCYYKYPDAKENVEKLKEAGAGVEFNVDGGRLEACKRVGKGRWSRVIMNFPHTGSGIKDQDRNIRDNQLLLLRVLRSVAPVLTTGPARLLPTSHTGLKRKSKSHGKNQQSTKKRKAESSDDEDDRVLGGEDVSDLEEDAEEEMDPAFLPPPSSTFTPPSVPGTLLITLLDQPPYTLWALRQLATRPPASIPNAKGIERGPQPRYALVRSFQFVPEVYEGYTHRRTLGFKEGVSKDANEEIVGRKGIARTWEFTLNPKED